MTTEAFAFVNKNLLNYPLARDTRVKLEWHENKKTGRYWACLPGDDRIKLSFPADADRRCPNGFDINVLFLMLSEDRKQGQSAITLSSLSAIVKTLGLGADGNANLRRVRDAFTLWSTITVKFENYYTAGKRDSKGKWCKGHNETRRFPPPILAQDIVGRGRTISIHDSWRPTNKYMQRVWLPLPMQAAAQNVVLAALVSINGGKPRSVRRFCRKIGLNHGARRRVLDSALRAAEEYFRQHRSSFSAAINDRRIALVIGNGEQLAERQPSQDEPHPVKPRHKIERVKRIKPVETEAIMCTGQDDGGRSCRWYEQPDGRKTKDRAGEKLLDYVVYKNVRVTPCESRPVEQGVTRTLTGRDSDIEQGVTRTKTGRDS